MNRAPQDGAPARPGGTTSPANRYERIEDYSDLGLGTDEPAIRRFTRPTDKKTLAPAATGGEGKESIPHEGTDRV